MSEAMKSFFMALKRVTKSSASLRARMSFEECWVVKVCFAYLTPASERKEEDHKSDGRKRIQLNNCNWCHCSISISRRSNSSVSFKSPLPLSEWNLKLSNNPSSEGSLEQLKPENRESLKASKAKSSSSIGINGKSFYFLPFVTLRDVGRFSRMRMSGIVVGGWIRFDLLWPLEWTFGETWSLTDPSNFPWFSLRTLPFCHRKPFAEGDGKLSSLLMKPFSHRTERSINVA